MGDIPKGLEQPCMVAIQELQGKYGMLYAASSTSIDRSSMYFENCFACEDLIVV